MPSARRSATRRPARARPDSESSTRRTRPACRRGWICPNWNVSGIRIVKQALNARTGSAKRCRTFFNFVIFFFQAKLCNLVPLLSFFCKFVLLRTGLKKIWKQKYDYFSFSLFLMCSRLCLCLLACSFVRLSVCLFCVFVSKVCLYLTNKNCDPQKFAQVKCRRRPLVTANRIFFKRDFFVSYRKLQFKSGTEQK